MDLEKKEAIFFSSSRNDMKWKQFTTFSIFVAIFSPILRWTGTIISYRKMGNSIKFNQLNAKSRNYFLLAYRLLITTSL